MSNSSCHTGVQVFRQKNNKNNRSEGKKPKDPDPDPNIHTHPHLHLLTISPGSYLHYQSFRRFLWLHTDEEVRPRSKHALWVIQDPATCGRRSPFPLLLLLLPLMTLLRIKVLGQALISRALEPAEQNRKLSEVAARAGHAGVAC